MLENSSMFYCQRMSGVVKLRQQSETQKMIGAFILDNQLAGQEVLSIHLCKICDGSGWMRFIDFFFGAETLCYHPSIFLD